MLRQFQTMLLSLVIVAVMLALAGCRGGPGKGGSNDSQTPDVADAQASSEPNLTPEAQAKPPHWSTTLDAEELAEIDANMPFLAEIEAALRRGHRFTEDEEKRIAALPVLMSLPIIDMFDRLFPLVDGRESQTKSFAISYADLRPLLAHAATIDGSFLVPRVLTPLMRRWSPEHWHRNGNHARFLKNVSTQPDHVPANWCVGTRDAVYCGVLANLAHVEGQWLPEMRLAIREIADDMSPLGDERRLAASVWISQIIECALEVLNWVSWRRNLDPHILYSNRLPKMDIDPMDINEFAQATNGIGDVERLFRSWETVESFDIRAAFMKDFEAYQAGEAVDSEFFHYRPSKTPRPWPNRLRVQLERLEHNKSTGGGGGGLRYFRAPKTLTITNDSVDECILEWLKANVSETSRLGSAVTASVAIGSYLVEQKADFPRIQSISNAVLVRLMADMPGSLEAEVRILALLELGKAMWERADQKSGGAYLQPIGEYRGMIDLSDTSRMAAFVRYAVAVPERNNNHYMRVRRAVELVAYAEAQPETVLWGLAELLRASRSVEGLSHAVEFAEVVCTAGRNRFTGWSAAERSTDAFGDLVREAMTTALGTAKAWTNDAFDVNVRRKAKDVLDLLEQLAAFASLGSEKWQLLIADDMRNALSSIARESTFAIPDSHNAERYLLGIEVPLSTTRLRLLFAGWDV